MMPAIANIINHSSFGLSKMKGVSVGLEYETILFDSFMNAKGGVKGPNKTEPTPDEPVLTDTYISGDDAVLDSEEFNIQINFYGEWTDVLKNDFILSADFLSALITNDIAPDGYNDLTISATLTEIDGSGGILGQAGPTYVWTDSKLPSQAVMEFDVADASNFENLGLWDDIVLHEMFHTVGFGTVWDLLGLVDTVVDTKGTRNPKDDTLSYIYNGDMATYYNGGITPVIETDGGAGTAGGHWDEETYGNELMTGWIDEVNYLSDMTYGSLQDMGYSVNYDAQIFIA